MQIGQRLSQFFELGKFSQLSHLKRFAVVGLTALSSVTIVGIIAAPFVWKGMTNLLANKKIKQLPNGDGKVGSTFQANVGHKRSSFSTSDPTSSIKQGWVEEKKDRGQPSPTPASEVEEESPELTKQPPSSPVVIQEDGEAEELDVQEKEEELVEDHVVAREGAGAKTIAKANVSDAFVQEEEGRGEEGNTKDIKEQHSSPIANQEEAKAPDDQPVVSEETRSKPIASMGDAPTQRDDQILRRGMAKFFSGEVADQILNVVGRKHHEKMEINQGDDKPALVAVVKKTEGGQGELQYVLLKDSRQRRLGYSTPLMRVQISTMLKTALSPEFKIADESNKFLYTGFLLFKKEGDAQSNYQVNEQGRLEKLTESQAAELIAHLTRLNADYRNK